MTDPTQSAPVPAKPRTARRSTERPVGVVHFGLGPIGLAIANLVNERPDFESVAAVDVEPSLAGRPLADLIENTSGTIFADAARALEDPAATVVCHCTGSSLERVAPQLLQILDAGLSIVSTCEELSYPWQEAPALATELDIHAKRRGVAVLGTGVNPGFAMDYLPVCLAGGMSRVDAVRVRRVQDAGKRRVPLQKKVGAGLSVEAFNVQLARGQVRHVGLRESAQAVAAAFGFALSELDETIEPIVADRPINSAFGEVRPGYVTGVRQVAIGSSNGREVVRLTLEMAVGLADPRDEIELDGEPDLRMIIPGGLHGDTATAAVVVNSIKPLLLAEPGLRVMAELPPPHA